MRDDDLMESGDAALTRTASTFAALAHEQIETVRRFLSANHPELSSDEGPVADHSLRLVSRGAEWLGLTELQSLTQELRESLALLGQIKPVEAEEIVAHARVSLEREERIVATLRAEGFGAILAQGGPARPRHDRGAMSEPDGHSARDLLDDTPDVGPHETLLGLTVEIKSAVVNQNERITAMSRTLDAAQSALLEVLSMGEPARKRPAKKRGSGGGAAPDEVEAREQAAHQRLQEASSELRTLGFEINRLLGLQYSLERRARDLDEHLLWEFLDPLDRFVDDLYAAVSRRPQSRQAVLTVRTGGVGFEPQIGALILPLLGQLIETAEPAASVEETPEIRIVASREDLEARISIEGYLTFDRATVAKLEKTLEDLAGYAILREAGDAPAQLRIQFPMARALRSFLIVEASGHRVALPWSAVDRIHAAGEDLGAENRTRPVLPLRALFGDVGGDEPGETRSGAGPLAVLRCGGRSVTVSFDRIVWRECARLTSLPPRLYPVRDVMGGIVAPDSTVTMVLSPCALVRKADAAAGPCGEADIANVSEDKGGGGQP
jgi:hypothetical protein